MPDEVASEGEEPDEVASEDDELGAPADAADETADETSDGDPEEVLADAGEERAELADAGPAAESGDHTVQAEALGCAAYYAERGNTSTSPTAWCVGTKWCTQHHLTRPRRVAERFRRARAVTAAAWPTEPQRRTLDIRRRHWRLLGLWRLLARTADASASTTTREGGVLVLRSGYDKAS